MVLCMSILPSTLSLSPSSPSLSISPSTLSLPLSLPSLYPLSPPPALQLVSTSGSSLPLPHQQALARRRLKQLLTATHRQIKLYACIQRSLLLLDYSSRVFFGCLDNVADIAENLLYVLWRHLQFYLVHCKPVGGATELGVGGVSFSKPAMRSLGGQLYIYISLPPLPFLPPLLLSFHFPHSVHVATCISTGTCTCVMQNQLRSLP